MLRVNRWQHGLDLATVTPERYWRQVQHKTGGIASGRLHGSTIDALQRLGTDPPCAWPRRSEAFCRQFARLVAAAGVRPGTFRWLRRSSGSYVEAEHPGQGHRHLGHSSPEVFRRHYDARLGEAPACPPEL